MILATLIACFIAPLVFLGAFTWYMVYVANNHKNNNMGKYFEEDDEWDYSDPEMDYRNEYGEV